MLFFFFSDIFAAMLMLATPCVCLRLADIFRGHVISSSFSPTLRFSAHYADFSIIDIFFTPCSLFRLIFRRLLCIFADFHFDAMLLRCRRRCLFFIRFAIIFRYFSDAFIFFYFR